MSFVDSLDDLEKELDRKDVDPRFHYVYQKKLLSVLTFSLIFNIIIFTALFVMINRRPPENIYLSSVDGKITRIMPYRSPVLTRETVAEWGRDALKTAYNFDHLQYDSQLAQSKTLFSDAAWDLFLKQFEEKVKPELISKKLLVTAAPDRAVVKSEGSLDGLPSWMLMIPVETTWSGATGVEYVRMMAHITVSRIQGDPKGVKITQFSIDASR